MIQTKLLTMVVLCKHCDPEGIGPYLKNKGDVCDGCGKIAPMVTYYNDYFIDSDGSLWDYSGMRLISKRVMGAPQGEAIK